MPPGLVVGVVGYFFLWLDSTLLSQTLVVFRLLRVSSIGSCQPLCLVVEYYTLLDSCSLETTESSK